MNCEKSGQQEPILNIVNGLSGQIFKLWSSICNKYFEEQEVNSNII